jgi:hypothetical protein
VRVRRAITALAAAAVLVSALTACQSKVGGAAFVGSTKITESQVAGYVDVNAPAPASGDPGPKALVVQELAKRLVFAKVVAALGSAPTDDDLASYHDSALSTLFGSQVSGAQADADLRQAAAKEGLKPSFDAVYLHNAELNAALSAYAQSASAADVTKINKVVTDTKVTINPRYGTWDPKQIGLAATTSPSWLTTP